MNTTNYPVPEDMDHLIQILSSFTNYEKSRDFHKGRVRFDLEMMERLLRAAGDPHLEVPCIHITGSKGKGSTALMTTEALKALGLRTGTYTSPHLERINERIAVNGDPLPDDQFLHASNRVLELLRRDESLKPTFFEFITATAMTLFHHARVDVAIHEVGLGGRLDCTNVLQPVAAVITTVEKEHCPILGHTEEEIAREKAGIIKEGVAVVTAVPEATPARQVIEKEVLRKGATLLAPGSGLNVIKKDEKVYVEYNQTISRPFLPPPPWTLHAWNGACALSAARIFMEKTGRAWREEPVLEALEKVRLPGRFEIFHRDPLLILDSAHTLGSIQVSLKEARRRAKKRLFVILGLAEDKEVEPILDAVLSFTDDLVYTPYPGGRSMDPEQLRKIAHGKGQIASSPQEALDLALGRSDTGEVVLITGSFYLAGAMRSGLQ